MSEMIIAFVIWCIVGFFFIGLGIYSAYSQKAVGFWANAEMFQVTDVKNTIKQCVNYTASWELYLLS